MPPPKPTAVVWLIRVLRQPEAERARRTDRCDVVALRANNIENPLHG